MNIQDVKIRKLLDCLHKNNPAQVSLLRDGVYLVTSCRFGAENYEQDHYESYVNFNDKTITVYGYDVSGHNGDYYGETKQIVDWKNLDLAYDVLKMRVEKIISRQVMSDLTSQLVETRMKNLLDE